MCGIFAYKGISSKAGDLILEGLRSLEYRGYDSWGVALKLKTKDSKLKTDLLIEKHVGKIGDAKLPKVDSSIGIGHTRWATHGGVTDINAHPHLDCTRKVVVVHNGIVENFEEFKVSLLKKGHKFVSQTDTEIIAHLIEDELKTKKPEIAIVNVFKSLSGLNAIIVFLPSRGEFYAIKNGSPLVFGQEGENFYLASDASALSSHTKQVSFLEDNELICVTASGFKLYDLHMKQKKPKFVELSYKKEDTQLGAYKHFMIKEISEQPLILNRIASEQKENIERIAKLIKNAFGTYFIGCGTAYYAALAGGYLFSKIAKKHVNTSVGSEFSYQLDFLTSGSLVAALSQSGETIDIISSVKKAIEKQASILAITNVLGSTLYRMADHKLLLNAGPEKCVLATKSFTAKIAFLYLISHALAGTYEDGTKQIKKAAEQIERLLGKKNDIKKLAAKLKNKEHIYILGRGLSYPTALESALKIKEVSYIHAEGFAGGELKHGVMALIEKGTPVIVYNPDDETYDDTLSSAYEVKARGAYLIGVSCKHNDIYDEFINVGDCGDATVIPNVVVAQLLGYYLALAKRLDPDKPRNLAKSVTVK